MGEHYGLSKEARLALVMGTGMVAGFGLEGIDKHFNISGFHRVNNVAFEGLKSDQFTVLVGSVHPEAQHNTICQILLKHLWKMVFCRKYFE